MNPPKGVQAAGADAIWAKLDPNGTGSVSKQDFVSGMTAQMSALRQHHHHGGSASGAQSQSPAQTVAGSLSALNGLGTNVDTTV
jgi:hypothetical protein